MADIKSLRFILKIENFGTWEWNKMFQNLEDAKQYASMYFEQNTWEIHDSQTKQVVESNDSFQQIQKQATLESERFAETKKWRHYFSESETKNRKRLTRIAAQQRAKQERLRESRDSFFQSLRDNTWDKKSKSPTVNWLKEGF